MQNTPDMAADDDMALLNDIESIKRLFAELNLSEGGTADLRDLIPPEHKGMIDICLYFDPDLARNSSLEQDLKDFAIVSELTRPFIRLSSFLDVMAKRDPEFIRALEQEPLIVEVLELGVRHKFYGCVLEYRPFVKVLLPER
jgi:hypothetical protein